MNSANNVAKWKTGFIRHKKGIGPIFISEFVDLFAAAHMYATRTYFLTGDSSILSVRYGFAHLVHILQFAIYVLSVNSWCPVHTCEHALDTTSVDATSVDATRIKADFHSVQNVARSIFSERFLLKCVKSTTANEIRSA